MALGVRGLGFFQLSLKIDYRRLDWCSLPLICSAERFSGLLGDYRASFEGTFT